MHSHLKMLLSSATCLLCGETTICWKRGSLVTHWVVGVLPPVMELKWCSCLQRGEGDGCMGGRLVCFVSPGCQSFNPESLTPKVCNSQGFDINIVPQSKCVLNFKKYILLRYYLIFFPTSFNISLFTENSWKLLSAICFLIKFLPHSHRQIWLLFYLWGCLGTMWLHSQVQCDWVWWWAWC